LKHPELRPTPKIKTPKEMTRKIQAKQWIGSGFDLFLQENTNGKTRSTQKTEFYIKFMSLDEDEKVAWEERAKALSKEAAVSLEKKQHKEASG